MCHAASKGHTRSQNACVCMGAGCIDRLRSERKVCCKCAVGERVTFLHVTCMFELHMGLSLLFQHVGDLTTSQLVDHMNAGAQERTWERGTGLSAAKNTCVRDWQASKMCRRNAVSTSLSYSGFTASTGATSPRGNGAAWRNARASIQLSASSDAVASGCPGLLDSNAMGGVANRDMNPSKSPVDASVAHSERHE